VDFKEDKQIIVRGFKEVIHVLWDVGHILARQIECER
jgi:hypothetical protein